MHPPETRYPLARRAGVLTSAATGLIDFIQRRGGDADCILGRAGIDPEHLLHPTRSLDLQRYCLVLEEAAAQTGDDNFGLRYGHQFKPDSLGLLGYIGMSSASLGDGLRNVAQAFPRHQQCSLLRFVEDGEFCRLDYQVQHGSIVRKRQDAELSLGMFLNLMRHALGSQWAPEHVHFEHPRPPSWHEHRKAFEAPVFFGQAMNSLVLRRNVLDRPMPTRDSRLLALLIDNMKLLATANESQATHDIVDEAKTRIQQLLPTGAPTLAQVANAMHLPAWTLQRRLGEQGLSFSTLVEQMRRELAAYYLQQFSLPLSDVAPMLGYSELSAFSRAFRRWFGASPRQWRQSSVERLTTH
ncbi:MULTISPECIES: AraC-like transcriptional regulator QhpR [unclassified Variovorax]|uniref:AraC-like transcriptional regulator QhpR n=1 Tax=unclassified Variovorax TaxID=663243 RepID=UPI003F487714